MGDYVIVIAACITALAAACIQARATICAARLKAAVDDSAAD